MYTKNAFGYGLIRERSLAASGLIIAAFLLIFILLCSCSSSVIEYSTKTSNVPVSNSSVPVSSESINNTQGNEHIPEQSTGLDYLKLQELIRNCGSVNARELGIPEEEMLYGIFQDGKLIYTIKNEETLFSYKLNRNDYILSGSYENIEVTIQWSNN